MQCGNTTWDLIHLNIMLRWPVYPGFLILAVSQWRQTGIFRQQLIPLQFWATFRRFVWLSIGSTRTKFWPMSEHLELRGVNPAQKWVLVPLNVSCLGVTMLYSKGLVCVFWGKLTEWSFDITGWYSSGKYSTWSLGL